jgi:ribosomal protein S18 acetylase RimI-like enzyme
MDIVVVDLKKDINELVDVANKAFLKTSDSDLTDWFSFPEMIKGINQNIGLCLKAVDKNKIIGMIYAQQESPVNGKESQEKWVIVITAVDPSESNKGTGSKLLEKLENILRERKIKKLFVYTNKDDQQVINFYKQNNYEDAGWIKDYQYGEGNSAVFLLKYLQN